MNDLEFLSYVLNELSGPLLKGNFLLWDLEICIKFGFKTIFSLGWRFSSVVEIAC